MKENPYSSPSPSPLAEKLYGDANRAYELVSGPAMVLIVLTAIWICLIVVGILRIVLVLVTGAYVNAPQSEFSELGISFAVEVAIQFVWGVVILTTNGVILTAALRMRSLRSYGLCQLGAILAVIPCIGPCYLVGIPIGIWALIALNRPGVRESFTTR